MFERKRNGRIRDLLGSYTTMKEDIDREQASVYYSLSRVVANDKQNEILKSVAMEFQKSK